MVSFERKGFVSVWVFRQIENPADADKDVLREFCGVDGYDIDSQEGIAGTDLQPIAFLLAQISYSDSFMADALAAAGRMGINEAYGAVVQFDFAYDPQRVNRATATDPVFVGCFKWSDNPAPS